MKLLLRRRAHGAPCQRCESIAARRRAADQVAREMSSWPTPVEAICQAWGLAQRFDAIGSVEIVAAPAPRRPQPFHFSPFDLAVLDAQRTFQTSSLASWPGV